MRYMRPSRRSYIIIIILSFSVFLSFILLFIFKGGAGISVFFLSRCQPEVSQFQTEIKGCDSTVCVNWFFKLVWIDVLFNFSVFSANSLSVAWTNISHTWAHIWEKSTPKPPESGGGGGLTRLHTSRDKAIIVHTFLAFVSLCAVRLYSNVAMARARFGE